MAPGNKDGWSLEQGGWVINSVGFAGPGQRYTLAVMNALGDQGGYDDGVATTTQLAHLCYPRADLHGDEPGRGPVPVRAGGHAHTGGHAEHDARRVDRDARRLVRPSICRTTTCSRRSRPPGQPTPMPCCSAGRRSRTSGRTGRIRQTDSTGITDYLNKVTKYVVSSTMTDPGWANSTVLTGDPIESVRELKRRPGQRHRGDRQHHADACADDGRPRRRVPVLRLPHRAGPRPHPGAAGVVVPRCGRRDHRWHSGRGSYCCVTGTPEQVCAGRRTGTPPHMLLRRVARPMLAAAFVGQGIDALRSPKPAADAARPALEGLQKLPEPVGSNVPPQRRDLREGDRGGADRRWAAAGQRKGAPARVGRVGDHGGSGQPRRAHVLDRGRSRTQGRQTSRLPDRHQPGRWPDHRIGRHCREAVAGLAWPQCGGPTVRQRRRRHCRPAPTPIWRTASGTGCRTACRWAPNAAANWLPWPPNEAHRYWRPPANAASPRRKRPPKEPRHCWRRPANAAPTSPRPPSSRATNWQPKRVSGPGPGVDIRSRVSEGGCTTVRRGTLGAHRPP